MLTGKVALVPAGAVVAVETAAADKEGCLHSRQTCLAHCVFILFNIFKYHAKARCDAVCKRKVNVEKTGLSILEMCF